MQYFFGSYQPAVIQVLFSVLLKLMGALYLTHRILWPTSCSFLLMSFWDYQYFLNNTTIESVNGYWYIKKCSVNAALISVGTNHCSVAPIALLLQWAGKAEDFPKFLGQKSCFTTRSSQFHTLLKMFNKQTQCNS